MKEKKDIRSLSIEELTSFFKSNNMPTYRANQVYNWLWKKSCLSFDEMTNISLELRTLMKSKFVINHIKIDKLQKSKDGTIKNAISLYDNLLVESVLILEPMSKCLVETGKFPVILIPPNIDCATNF